jgi:hypothetical protein
MKLRNVCWIIILFNAISTSGALFILTIAHANRLPFLITLLGCISVLIMLILLILDKVKKIPLSIYLAYFVFDSLILLINIIVDILFQIKNFSFFEGVINGGIPSLLLNLCFIILISRSRSLNKESID